MQIKPYTRGKVFSVREVEKCINCITADFSLYERREKSRAVYSRWKINFVGEAYNLAKKLEERDEIILLQAKIEKFYNKDVNEMFIFITCYQFRIFYKENKGSIK